VIASLLPAIVEIGALVVMALFAAAAVLMNEGPRRSRRGDERTFGPYLLNEEDPGHLVVRRCDGEPAEPSWYELQTMARMAWGQGALAVEIFPPGRELVDGQHQRHLWLVPADMAPSFPSLADGRRWTARG
jgi:hypothetical protein